MAAVTYGGSGQTQPGGRRSSYNRAYWKAAEKDINKQHSKLRFPSRKPASPTLKKLSTKTPFPGYVRGKSVETQKTFAGKRANIQR